MDTPLTKLQAEQRFESFEKGIEYNMYLHLKKGKTFTGYGQYNFKLKKTENVFLNYNGKTLNTLKINGQTMQQDYLDKNLKNGFLDLKPENLKIGQNIIEIKFSSEYNTDGNGLHSMLDTDGQQYIYVQTEPFYNNRVYPIFDQPDLKAKMKFHFIAPTDWSIVSNTAYKTKMVVSDYLACNSLKSEFENILLGNLYEDFSGNLEQTFYMFNQTPLLSTYLFAFVGGPYESIKYDNFDGEFIPMSILCKKSDLEYAVKQQKDIFLYCKRGIEFYEKFFQTPNPFEKYDLVFCPEFTVGAMEFPGVITFTDYFIYKQVPTKMQISSRGDVITHELAHMWFGNYVTMKWWNDLWLNESFADFVCFLCMHNIDPDMPFTTVDAWTNMLITKSGGYREDQLDTTHPVASEVSNTNVAESIFDGITYCKGAAVVKQLFFMIGEKKFSDNLKKYFSKYAWSNATLENFLEELCSTNTEEEKKIKSCDLEFFNQEWIKKAGLNQIQAQWDSSVQGKQTLTFIQTPAREDYPTLRYHKLKFACLNENCEVVHVEEFVLDNKKETKLELVNNNYKAIIPNYEDWGYIKVLLDENSLRFLEKNLSKIKDPLTLLLVIRSLYDMVRDAKYKGTEFVDSLINSGFLMSLKDNLQILQATSSFISGAISLSPKTFEDEYRGKVFNEMEKLLNVATQPDVISILKKILISNAISFDNIDKLKMMFDENHPTLNLKFDLRENWKIIYKINCSSRYSAKQKDIYVKYMLNQDKTDIGQKWLLAINALTEDDEELEKLWENYTNKDKRTFSHEEMSYSLVGFTTEYRQTYQRHKYLKKFFEILPEYFKNDSVQFGREFFDSAFRNWENDQYLIDQMQIVLTKLDDNQDFFKIELKKSICSIERGLKCLKLYEI